MPKYKTQTNDLTEVIEAGGGADKLYLHKITSSKIGTFWNDTDWNYPVLHLYCSRKEPFTTNDELKDYLKNSYETSDNGTLWQLTTNGIDKILTTYTVINAYLSYNKRNNNFETTVKLIKNDGTLSSKGEVNIFVLSSDYVQTL